MLEVLTVDCSQQVDCKIGWINKQHASKWEQQLTEADSLDKLGKIYLKQGQYSDAELIYQRYIELCEQALGPEHPNVAGGYCNLGIIN